MTHWQPKSDFFPLPVPRKGSKRVQRVADMIQHEIGLLLVTRLKDPRLAHVSILQVTVTKDLRQAKIFYSIFGDERKVREAAAGMASAKGFIRKHLARTLNLRTTPELTFERDLSLVRQEEMERLFKELHSEDEATD